MNQEKVFCVSRHRIQRNYRRSKAVKRTKRSVLETIHKNINVYATANKMCLHKRILSLDLLGGLLVNLPLISFSFSDLFSRLQNLFSADSYVSSQTMKSIHSHFLITLAFSNLFNEYISCLPSRKRDLARRYSKLALDRYCKMANDPLPQRDPRLNQNVLGFTRFLFLEALFQELRTGKVKDARHKEEMPCSPLGLIEETRFRVRLLQDCHWNSFMFYSYLLKSKLLPPPILAYLDVAMTRPSDPGLSIFDAMPIHYMTPPPVDDIDSDLFRPSGTSVKHDPIRILRTKTRNRISQTRMFDDCIIVYMIFSAWYRNFVIEILIVCLIGNLPMIPVDSQASGSFRWCLHKKFFMIRHMNDSWKSFEKLIRHAYWVCIHSVQLYFYFIIHCYPALYDVTREKLHIDKCMRIVIKSVDYARRQLQCRDGYNLFFQLDGSSIVPDTEKEYLWTMRKDMKKMFHIPMSRLATPKNIRHFWRSFKSCERVPESALTLTPSEYHLTHRVYGVIPHQYDCMRQLVMSIHLDDPMPERFLIDTLEAFGSPSEAVDQLKSIMYDHCIGKIITKALKEFSNRFPHTWNLCQLFQVFWWRKIMFRTYPLPIHTRTAQIAAIKHRYGLKPDSKVLPQPGTHLLICTICNRIISYVRSWGRDNRKGIDPGYMNCISRFDVNEGVNIPYCNGTGCFDGKRCGDTPLVWYPILGRFLAFGDPWDCDLIFICPQPKCGIPAIYDPACAKTKYGYSCYDCTSVIQLVNDENATANTGDENLRLLALFKWRSQRIEDKIINTSWGDLSESDAKRQIDEEDAKKTDEELALEMGKYKYPDCYVCPRRIERMEDVIQLPLGMFCCPRHKIHGQKGFMAVYNSAEAPFESILNEDCVSDKYCRCSDLKSTCTGEYNRISIIKRIHQIDEHVKFIRKQGKKRKPAPKKSKSCNSDPMYKKQKK